MGRKPKKRETPESDSDDDRRHVGVAVESLDADDATFRDEIADFHLQKGKLMLDEADADSDDVLEEEFGGTIDPADLASSDDDENDSDEDDSGEEEERDPSKAWGNKASTYYGTDYVDYGLGGDDLEDEAAALAEEEEAKAYQARQHNLLSTADHAWGDMGDEDEGEEEERSEGDKETKAVMRKAGWSDEQWMNHLEKTHDEVATLKGLIAAKMKQADEVEVLLKRGRALPPTPNTKQVLVFLGYKFQVLLMAIQHAAFYVHIIFKEIPAARHHPVVKAIFKDQGLMEHLEKCGRDGGMDYLVRALETGTDVEAAALEGICAMKAAGLTPGVCKSKRKRVKKKSKAARALIAKRRAAQDPGSGDVDLAEDGEEGDEPARKRAITYEMAKNKGLTPHRKKEVRNPRVKMRKKFRKAVIRRKGQVRAVKRQEGSYGGEATGIRRDVVKSVKF